MKLRTLFRVVQALFLASSLASALAQEVSIPDPGLDAAIRAALPKPFGPLTEQDLLSLTNLNAGRRNVRSIVGLEAARNLVSLDLQINRLTNFSLPSELTKLNKLDVSINPLASFFLPSGLTNLTQLTLESDGFTNLTLPAGLTGLKSLDLENNQLASFSSLSNLTSLVDLDLGFNSFTNFSLPSGLTNLSTFYFAGNPLTNVLFPPGLAGMTELNLSQNLLTSFTLPAGMTNLIELNLFFNQLTNFIFPPDLSKLTSLSLGDNQLTNFTLPAGLTNLEVLDLAGDELTSFTLPPDQTKLTSLSLTAVFFDGTRLATFVLSEPLAATNLADTVAFLRSQGVLVVTYPLAIQLVSPARFPDGTFNFALIGPPGVYSILASTDLAVWSELATVTNSEGVARFEDLQANLSPAKFYRASLR